jgi:tRNA threonylcarbamoyladenosine biosynthesis protein TsaE
MTERTKKEIASYTTNSAEETIAAGRELAVKLPPGIILLRGELGAGKTTLVKGIAQALSAASPDEVTSPTFTLVHEYTAGRIPLYHLDLYRLEHDRELIPLGLEEMEDSGAILLVEWGEKFPVLQQRAGGEIALRATGEEVRRITLTQYI